ncbi:zinc finger protein 678-like isoform X2 [Belonocnema kinseyi]|uniref:zinc finger protein 678-like isoform X2 n=1 Tax=Belonocnema kinseyi TaxID=2817044 RepID=UPI00143DD75C|nr:zinc finger protein 678-like isoform X2 [Belonocnema kinseyi]
MEDVQIKSEPEESTGRDDDWSDFCITTHISSDNNSSANTLIEYENDDNLEIKEEVIEDKEEEDISAGNSELWSQNKQRIQESRHKLGKKYKCKKCARTYSHLYSLTHHLKYECDVTPQFDCTFCGKQFKRKNHMNRHVGLVHLKKNLETSQKTYNCDQCSRSYKRSYDLNRHKRKQHEEIRRHFTCDFCGYNALEKSHLSRHITARHLK